MLQEINTDLIRVTQIDILGRKVVRTLKRSPGVINYFRVGDAEFKVESETINYGVVTTDRRNIKEESNDNKWIVKQGVVLGPHSDNDNDLFRFIRRGEPLMLEAEKFNLKFVLSELRVRRVPVKSTLVENIGNMI